MPLPADEYIPQHTGNKRPLLVWLLVSVGALVVSLMIVSAPLAVAGNHNLIAFAIYRTFSSVCHQLPERSFFIAGHQFAVCARCTGLYVGFTLATIVYPLVRSLRQIEAPARKWLFFA